MPTLTSEYQFIGRSNSIPPNSGSYSYYVLLYAKTEANEASSLQNVTIKEVLACTTNSSFYQYRSEYAGTVNGISTFSGTNKPDKAWELTEFTEGGVTYKVGTVIAEGTVAVDMSGGSDRDITVSCRWKRTTQSSENYVPEYGTEGKVSATVTLPAVYKVATVSATDSYIGSSSVIVIGNMSTSYFYELLYQFEGDGYATYIQKEILYPNSTYAWTVPESIYDRIPNEKKISCTVVCRTFSKSGVRIGASTATITLMVNESKNLPSIECNQSIDSLTLNLTGDSNRLIYGVSRITLRFSVKTQNGASLSKVIVRAGKSYDLSIPVPTSESVYSFAQTVESITSKNIAIEATDSRGLRAVYEIRKELVNYIPLTLNPSISRSSPTSDTLTFTASGNYFNGAFDEGGSNMNTLSVTIESRELGENAYSPLEEDVEITIGNNGNYSASVEASGYDYDKIYEIKFTIVDRTNVIQQVIRCKKGVPAFDWGERGFCFHVPIHYPNEPLIVTGEFPTSWSGSPMGATSTLGALSHTWDEIGEAFEAGRDVRIRFTNTDPSYEFGGWNLRYAELTLSKFEANIPAAGYYNIYASGMGYAVDQTLGYPEATPMHINVGMSNVILLSTPVKK